MLHGVALYGVDGMEVIQDTQRFGKRLFAISVLF